MNVPTNKDCRRLMSCSGFFAHPWMMAPRRVTRLGMANPQMPAYAFRKVLLFRVGLPVSADDGDPGSCVYIVVGRTGLTPKGITQSPVIITHNEFESAILGMAAECDVRHPIRGDKCYQGCTWR